MNVSVTKNVYLTDTMLNDALDASIRAQGESMVEAIRANMESMGIKDSGREIDSVQAVMSDWSSPLGSKAQSSDRMDAPTEKHVAYVGTGVPYAGVNEFGDGVTPPRPAIRQGAKINNNIIADAYNNELRIKGLK